MRDKEYSIDYLLNFSMAGLMREIEEDLSTSGDQWRSAQSQSNVFQS